MNNYKHLNVFIGYDERQALAYQVCKLSLEQTASAPLTIYPLKHRELRDIGLLTREWKIQKDGLTIDIEDTRPFSTNFAFTRFLVPEYANYLGIPANEPSVFVDSDFVFLKDIYRLNNEIDFDSKPVWCVKHDYNPPNVVKMDNQSQVQYNKKLWSSFMVFNRAHPDFTLSLEDVNTKPGMWLHGFQWLKSDTLIGEIPEWWNFIPDHSEKHVSFPPAAIHYTEGVPLLKPGCRYAEIFNRVLEDVLKQGKLI